MDDSTGCAFKDLIKECRPGDFESAVDGMVAKISPIRKFLDEMESIALI